MTKRTLAKRRGDHLIVVLDSQLTLAALEGPLPERLRVGDRDFIAVERDDFTGTYDWLRVVDGAVVGVRYWPLEGHVPEGLWEAASRPYSRRDPDGRYFEVFFGTAPSTPTAGSDDQSFGGNRRFVDSTDVSALSFETYSLNDAELDSLARAHVRWEGIELPEGPRPTGLP